MRNFEQLRETPTAIFFTGTVSPERYDYIKEKYNLKTDNEIITKIHRAIPRKDKKGDREKHETLVRNRKRTYQHKKNTPTRNILCA